LAKVIRQERRFRALKGVRCDVAMATGEEGLDQLGVGEAFVRVKVDFGYERWPWREPRVDPRLERRDVFVLDELDSTDLKPLPDDDDDL
jgi:hypothetical protein